MSRWAHRWKNKLINCPPTSKRPRAASMRLTSRLGQFKDHSGTIRVFTRMSASDPLVSHRTVVGSSDRTFGLVFAGFFLIVALWPLIGGRPLRVWALGLALVFLATGVFAPRLLTPLNRIWARLGLLLHH